MDPFDPDAEFEDLVLTLNDEHRPGSLISGKTRNALIRAWALFAGKDRAIRELHAAIARHGSRTALARNLCMSRGTLTELEEHFRGVPHQCALSPLTNAFRSALQSASLEEQVDAVAMVAELLRASDLIKRLKSSRGPAVTRLLETALRAAELQDAVETLRALLDSGVADEASYQEWCDAHSWVFAGAHRLRDDVRRLHKDSVADLLLPDVVGYRDIVELKRPDATVLKYDGSHGTYYWSMAAAKAVGQVHKYMDRLHDMAREGLEKFPHVVAYHPRAIVVIGRSRDWSPAQIEALRGLNQRLHGIDVLTYDYLLTRAETILAALRGHEELLQRG